MITEEETEARHGLSMPAYKQVRGVARRPERPSAQRNTVSWAGTESSLVWLMSVFQDV